MTSSQILIVSEDAEFVRALSARWRKETNSPSITAVSINISGQANPSGYALVVVGPLRQGAALPQAPSLHLDSTVCAVGDLGSLASVRAKHTDWLLLPEYPGWTEALLSVAREVLRRTSAEKRAREAELTNHAHQRLSILGRSMLEVRPGMINALTSLLGNADLILLSEEPLPAECREQVRTIRTMALRLNEMVQRFSSLESEMELNDRKSQIETSEKRMVEAS
ncbi:MAG TPA: hypothetical protein VN025_13060, partial [Candidatus Dormibacteraeota bacterium]|nr:hypothetical protein [Candidatus Dormibacteraeota bacterium]